MIKKFITASILAIFGLGMLSGCNTIGGFGEDVEKAGDAIEDSAKKNKKY